MEIDKKDKKWIDDATYQQMLQRWRYGDGDQIFQGKCGKYYSEVMGQKKG